MPTALITGASDGLGRALATELATRGWELIVDARRDDRLARVAADISARTRVTAIAGDVADGEHRRSLIAQVQRLGRLDLLVNNASTLGPTPLRPLPQLSTADLARILQVNVLAPFALTRALLPALATTPPGIVIDISSDAAVEHYPSWGGYGASKAALEHLTATFALEVPQIAWYAVDPGDMRTQLQQAAFPGEDISDRRAPADVVPALLDLLDRRPTSGRYRAGDGVASAQGEIAAAAGR